MKKSINNYYKNLQGLVIYQNKELKGIKHFNNCLVRVNMFYLSEYLLLHSIRNNTNMSFINKLYYKYICERTYMKEFITEHIELFEGVDINKNHIMKELIRERRTIGLLLNIYLYEKKDTILEGLIQR